MSKELSKAYEPKQYEDKIYKHWEKSGFFNPDVCIKKGVAKPDAPHFSIVLPPPNVTGTLHMGHAAMLAIEDVMVRYHRMKGDRTLWVPGTDHAAVATQSKVEKILIKETGQTRHDLGRDQFLKKVDEFAQKSHDTIVNQCRKLGSSLDWSREAFTLDEKRSHAVHTIFKKMYDDGLIYRAYKAVNWSVAGQSTLSDDEIVHVERSAKLYTFKYSNDFPFTIATTRPETKLGDTAVAVNPKDKRYKKYIGQEFEVDFIGQKLKLKIIGDEGVDMEFGTGALGVTPAHSIVDYEMGVKNSLDLIQVIGEDGKITENGGEFAGLTVLEARERVVGKLKGFGLFEKEEDIVQNVGTSDRFEDVVEVLPKLQWFVDVNKKFKIEKSKIKKIKSGQMVSLKSLMQAAVKNGQIKILPEHFEKTYFHWIDNLRDWCISRQIWYGHQIPVWYCQGDNCRDQNGFPTATIGVEKAGACIECGGVVEQDPDTLDTWFSSGLWTFSTLGWPEETADMKNFHPTSVMETGYDILFFWVARMILMTTYTLGDIPFETVYLHGLVRDEQGRKMSKSLGNTIDPLDMIEKYGTDATRLSLLIGSTPGNDMKLSEAKVEGFRNFTNKLWNISRFMLLNIDEPKADVKLPKTKTLADEWILNLLGKVSDDVSRNIEQFNFSIAGELLRDFVWSELADWYLEIAKVEQDKSQMLNYILNTVLKLFHPFMPYVTEVIWEEIYGEDKYLLVEKWPASAPEELRRGEARFEIIKDLITCIRAMRADYKIEPAKKIVANIFGKNLDLINENSNIICALGRLEKLQTNNGKTELGTVAGMVVKGYEIYIDLSGAVDVEKEKTRLQKEIDSVSPYVISLSKKLENKSFVDNAPPQVVDVEKKKLSEAKEKLEKLEKQLQSLIK